LNQPAKCSRIPSSVGNNYLPIIYDYNSSSILAKPIKSHTGGAAILTGYQAIYAKLFTTTSLCPRLQHLDNECSEPLKQFLGDEETEFQQQLVAPPGSHPPPQRSRTRFQISFHRWPLLQC
jgi:hypothetical protein